MALKALTANPALFVNAYDRVGALKKDYQANFFITDKPVFSDDASIIQHWVAGEPLVFAELNIPDIRGNYLLETGKGSYSVSFSGSPAAPKAHVRLDTSRKEFNYSMMNNLITFAFPTDTSKMARATGNYNPAARQFDGKGQWADGNWFSFTMKFISMVDTTTKPRKPQQLGAIGVVIYPFTSYGEPLGEKGTSFREAWNKQKKQGVFLFRDATVWTNVNDSMLKEYDVLVTDGKITKVAADITPPVNATVINAKGMHLTPGIIDEHSHIAIAAGVNEGAQASSAEVRMGDVVNPEDVNIYRQLAGGVTTAQLLHGSANPIGGQSVLIKLRWGHGAEDMKFENAPPFIKFALGENVKQSNWGDRQVIRFPQSRMGVEQVYVDFFTRAREYAAARNAKPGKKDKSAAPPVRRDLELDALAEILAGKRYITCHSYVQSEINMLMHVADSMGFKVNTFTHILEGYKVADKMKAHGANASTFADWWAYKNEVMEAIPYNAALVTRVGLNVAINSDDAEMARRLNQEAAKCVKYGGLTEVEALKLVTLNPAKMLHIDNRVGSISPGKDADLVLWTDHPLSVYATVSKTMIDGRIYFDRETDDKLRAEMKAERARIISKMLVEKKRGAKVSKPVKHEQRLYYCNTIEGIDEAITGQR
jgi:imidazolonepropionase-like amidohydrolase